MGTPGFGVQLFTSSQRNDSCGANGLPLTPNGIKILGLSQKLKTFRHPHLGQYVDIVRAKHERIITVSEFYPRNLQMLLKGTGNLSLQLNLQTILEICSQILGALTYLNEQGVVVMTLSPRNILFDNHGNVKIFNYGLGYITSMGKYVNFPVGNSKYIPPDLLQSSVVADVGNVSYSFDVWSLGIIIIEMTLKKEIWLDLSLKEIMKKKYAYLSLSGTEIMEEIYREHKPGGFSDDLPPEMTNLIKQCLEPLGAKRIHPKNLINTIGCYNSDSKMMTESDSPRPNACPLTAFFGTSCRTNKHLFNVKDADFFQHLDLQHIYYLWQLAGGDLSAELRRQGIVRKKAPVLSLPGSIALEGEVLGSSKERGMLLDESVIVLSLNELHKRLRDISVASYFPLIVFKIKPGLTDQSHVGSKLPLVIREKDIEYQYHRIVLFDRILAGYPFTSKLIRKEAMKDIPPLFRGKIWACLLNVTGDVQYIYEMIDKETPTTTDRQIEVDIPRCHQYDELLSSPSGHEKFKRVLKAWVVSNEKYVYWQGLDSLCAPFLYLHFNDEAMAFACLNSFIEKYLQNLFLKDNTEIIQDYLSKFSQLMAYHDSQLTNHLTTIGFNPELYAIPWFLTMFSHVFPLHKIFHIWDKLLLGDSSFPLCIGLSILLQLRESLLVSGFNECILLFSDMPEINIEKCVEDSVELYNCTPPNTFRRKHDSWENFGLRKN